MAYIIYPGLIPSSPPPEKPGRGKRLVREVVREGRWLIGDDPSADSNYLSITPQMLETLRRLCQERVDAGILVPLQWDHNPDNELHTDDSQRVIDYFEEFWLEDHEHGKSLWAGFYPGSKTETLAELKTPVSPFIKWNVADGTGKIWPVALVHVALVDLATIPAQNGFVAMALPETAGLKNVEISAVIEMLNKLLGMIKPGLAIPDTVTDAEQLAAFLDMALSVVGGEEPAEDSPAEDVPPVLETPPAVAMSLKAVNAELAKVRAEIAVLRGQKEQDSERAFVNAVDGAIAMGLPAVSKDALLALGKANDWNVASLEPFKSMGSVALGLKSPKSVTPPTGGDEELDILAAAGFLSPEAKARQSARLK